MVRIPPPTSISQFGKIVMMGRDVNGDTQAYVWDTASSKFVNSLGCFINCTFQMSGSNGAIVTPPANAGIAPPGFYMLFAIDYNGVPTMARYIRLVNLPDGPGGN